jgi:hypothetical protein
MPRACQTVFYQQSCQEQKCGMIFYICQHCYRGQVYCSQECRQESFQQKRREANRRYQRSAEARADHRERQRAYRLREAQKKRDRSWFKPTTECANIGPPEPNAAKKTIRTLGRTGHLVCCRFCGRSGSLVYVSTSPRRFRE